MSVKFPSNFCLRTPQSISLFKKLNFSGKSVPNIVAEQIKTKNNPNMSEETQLTKEKVKIPEVNSEIPSKLPTMKIYGALDQSQKSKLNANYYNHVNGFVNSQEVRMLVDTGATISLISSQFQETLHSPIIPLEIPVQTITATQEPIIIKGYSSLEVAINGFVAQHKFLIANKIGEK